MGFRTLSHVGIYVSAKVFLYQQMSQNLKFLSTQITNLQLFFFSEIQGRFERGLVKRWVKIYTRQVFSHKFPLKLERGVHFLANYGKWKKCRTLKLCSLRATDSWPNLRANRKSGANFWNGVANWIPHLKRMWVASNSYLRGISCTAQKVFLLFALRSRMLEGTLNRW